MRTNSDKISYETEKLYREAEAGANRFNLMIITVLLVFSAASEILNEIGVFTLDKTVMRIFLISELLLFGIPMLAFLIHDVWKKKTPKIS